MEIAEPVLSAQRTFRTLLDAMAEPALALELDAGDAAPGLHATTSAVLASLADVDTPVWITRPTAALQEWIAFRTGAPMAELTQATFAVIRSGDAWPDLPDLAQGTAEYPDRSATLIAEVEDFSAEARTFDGPGFERPRQLSVSWPVGFDAAWVANSGRFPLGIDLILASPTHIAGLPRSVRLAEAA